MKELIEHQNMLNRIGTNNVISPWEILVVLLFQGLFAFYLGLIFSPLNAIIIFFIGIFAMVLGIIFEKIDEITSPLPASGKNVNFTLQLSEVELGYGEVCPVCAGKIELLEPHRDIRGEITHYDAECIKCGMKGEVINGLF